MLVNNASDCSGEPAGDPSYHSMHANATHRQGVVTAHHSPWTSYILLELENKATMQRTGSLCAHDPPQHMSTERRVLPCTTQA